LQKRGGVENTRIERKNWGEEGGRNLSFRFRRVENFKGENRKKGGAMVNGGGMSENQEETAEITENWELKGE